MTVKTAAKNIEVELRSFITKAQHAKLLAFFKRVADYLGRDEQVTYYFSGPHDLRIQKNLKGAKLWLKGGKLHDVHREETEVWVARDDFEKLEQIFAALGFEVSIKWFRTRHEFSWRGVRVSLDATRGYGHIIELEKMTVPEKRKEAAALLAKRFIELGIAVSPRDAFKKRFAYYKKHWRELI